MTRRTFLASALLALLTLTGGAKADATDFDFAKGLMDREYYDLAEAEFQRLIEDSSRSIDERREGELGLCFLKAKVAIREALGRRADTDPAPVLELFGDAKSAFDDFFQKAGNHPRATEARFEMGAPPAGR